MAPLDPIRMTQVLLFAEQRTYTKFAASVWAAMIESEQFFRAADLVEDCVRGLSAGCITERSCRPARCRPRGAFF